MPAPETSVLDVQTQVAIPLRSRLRGLSSMRRWHNWRAFVIAGPKPEWYLVPGKTVGDSPVASDPSAMFGNTSMFLGRTKQTGCRFLLTVSYLVPDNGRRKLPVIHAAHCASAEGGGYLLGPTVRSRTADGETVLGSITLRVERPGDSFDRFLADPDALNRRLHEGTAGLLVLESSDVNWIRLFHSFAPAVASAGKHIFGEWPSRLRSQQLDEMERVIHALAKSARTSVSNTEGLGAPSWLISAGGTSKVASEEEAHKMASLTMWHWSAATGLYDCSADDGSSRALLRRMGGVTYPSRAFATEFGQPDIDVVAEAVSQIGGLQPGAFGRLLGLAHDCASQMLRSSSGDEHATRNAVAACNAVCRLLLLPEDPQSVPGELLLLVHLLRASLHSVLGPDRTVACPNCFSLFLRRTEASDKQWSGTRFCSDRCAREQGQRRREFREALALEFPRLADAPPLLDYAALSLIAADTDNRRAFEMLRRVAGK